MTLKEVLAVLTDNNIRLGLDQDNLKIRAAKGAITPEIKALLIKFKPELLDWVKAKQEAKEQQAPIPKRSDGAEQTLSFTQQRLWFIDQLNPGDPSYNVPAAIKISGPLNVPVLQQVFDEIVRRHEILRTSFINLKGEAVQQLHDTLSLPVDRDALEQQPSQQTLLALASEEAARPFNLANEPLIRVKLIQLNSDQEHLLLLNLHHIVTDGWSNGVIMKEVSELYQSFSNGQPSPLAELPIQYADFAIWQRSFLSEERLNKKISYWQNKLADLPILELPTDHPRPVQRSGRGQQVNFSIPADITAKLNELAQQHSSTLFIVLMAAFNTLLYRYTGQEDLCVGTPTAGRNRAELTDLIGFFINTLALRSDLSGDPGFDTLIAQINQTMREAQEHQDVPFESIVESLGLSRDMSVTPIFQTLLVLQNAPMAEELPQSGLSFEMLTADSQSAKFDLSFNIKEFSDHLVGSAEFDTDLFDESTIERMVGHFNQLLVSIAENPKQQISKLALLSTDEQQQVLVDWNKTRAIYPRNMSMASQFEQLAGRLADNIAIDFPNQQLTYAELNKQASQLAHQLKKHGVKSGDRVAICLDRSVEMVIGLVAILKLGAAYVPLDPNYPEDRLSFMLEDTQAPLIITIKENLQQLESLPLAKLPTLLLLDEQQQEISSQADDWQSETDNAQGEQLAYIMYTSGSTGRPKGVMIPQRAIIRLVKNTNFVDLGPDDATGHISNVCFDAATLEFWGALLNGGRIVGIPKEVLLDRQAFEATLRDKQVTTMFITVTLFNLYISEAPKMFSSVKNLLVGGEALDPNKIRQTLAGSPPARLLNGYGPTENTTFTTYYEISSLAADVSSVPLGYPLANTTTYILDKNRQPVPIGVAGELCTGGDGVALGYLNREDLNKDKFIADPYSDKPGSLMYCTGDVCRWLPDGRIEMTGRIDDQVKIRGFRIELGEIDNTLGQIAGVRECAVIVRNDDNEGKYLAGYIVPETAQEDEEASLNFIQKVRLKLQDLLPFYMLPTALVLIDSLPLTSNGKLDKRALPEPDISQQLSQEYVAPRNEQEEKIAEIWQEVLNVEKVGINDNFFELGGHSLLATRVTARISEQLEIDLPLKALFESPTVAGITDLLQHAEARKLPAMEHADRNQALPISFAQQRMWIVDQIQPDSPMYNIPLAMRISGSLDVKVLERVFAKIFQRHEILRTKFISADDEASQLISEFEDWTLPQFELKDDDTLIKERALAFLLAPFKLSEGPLLRVQLLKLLNDSEQQPAEYVLLASMHHIISDGWSVDVLMQEITALYPAFAAGLDSPLPVLDFHYADFSSWQRSWLQGEILEEQIDYWRKQLDGVPSLELPTDHSRPPIISIPSKRVHFQLSEELSNELRSFSRNKDCTLFMTLLAAFQTLLSRYCSEEDIAVGTPIANRTHPALEPMIGFFVNTLVMRNQIDTNATFDGLLRQVKHNTLDAYRHQDLPFEKLVDELDVPRNLANTPLVQVMFVLQNTASLSSGLDKLAFGELEFSPLLSEKEGEGAAKFDLSCALVDDQNGIYGDIEYRSALFERSTIERLIEHFKMLLNSILKHSNAPIGQLSMLSNQERHQLLIDHNASQSHCYESQTIHHQFEKMAVQFPDNIAVSCNSQTISYAELNKRANQLARELQAKGVTTGSFVGLCLDRSIELLTGLLGIIKAGGAYIPLDPHFPSDRLQFILEDSEASLLVSSSDLQDSLPDYSGERVNIDNDWQNISQHASDNLNIDIPIDSTIYVLYTSGTTGQPKGCLVSHANVHRLFSATDKDFGFNEKDTWTLFHSYAFDFTVWEIWGALLYGGKLVVVPYLLSRSPDEFYQLLIDEKVTVLNQTPSAFSQVIAIEDQQTQHQPLDLRYVIFGGEALDFNALQTWVARHGIDKPQLINMYGITETTVHVTVHRITTQDMEQGLSIIGRPLSDLHIYLLDSQGQLAPMGVPAEIHVSGGGVTKGYLKRDKLTAEKFIANPFAKELPAEQRSLHATLYRSGDQARYLSNGNIEYMGRIDQQVKIRGHRIELGEIEAQLAALDEVREAVLTVYEHDGDKRLVAYLLLPDGALETDLQSIRNQLKEHLPVYMIPAAFIILEAWPLTPTGKINKKALPEPELGQAIFASYVAPSTETETTLATIWAKVIGVEQVGIHDNFFELGGHSLMAIKLVTALREKFDIELQVASIFEIATMEEMANHIDNILWTRQDSETSEQPQDNEDREEFEL